MSDASRWLGSFWTPLVAITAAHEGQRSGQIAVSVHGASIVAQRPRLTAALWKTNYTRDLVERSGAFAVHLLRDDQDDLVYRLGLRSGRDLDKLAPLDHEVGQTGTPLLRHCLAVFECRVINQMDGGDHTLFLGEVVHSAARLDGEPLWWRDLRTRIPEDHRRAWEAKNGADVAEALRVIDQVRR